MFEFAYTNQKLCAETNLYIYNLECSLKNQFLQIILSIFFVRLFCKEKRERLANFCYLFASQLPELLLPR